MELMPEIDIHVPESLFEEIEEEQGRRGYEDTSEVVQDALLDWIEPSAPLSEETLEDLSKSREQAERGETLSENEVRDRLSLDG